MTKPTTDERDDERLKQELRDALGISKDIIDELQAEIQQFTKENTAVWEENDKKCERIVELEAENARLKADVELAKLHWWKGKR